MIESLLLVVLFLLFVLLVLVLHVELLLLNLQLAVDRVTDHLLVLVLVVFQQNLCVLLLFLLFFFHLLCFCRVCLLLGLVLFQDVLRLLLPGLFDLLLHVLQFLLGVGVLLFDPLHLLVVVDLESLLLFLGRVVTLPFAQ